MSLLKDLRYGARKLVHNPGFAAVTVMTLALGIGLTTTMFSIVYGALMRGLPFEHPERIVSVRRANPVRDFHEMEVSPHDFVDYRAQARSFEGLAAFTSGTVNVSGSEKPERFDGAYMSANALSAGTSLYAQYWSRDTGYAAPNNVGLTDAVGFTICP